LELDALALANPSAISALSCSITPNAVKSPEIVLFKCHAGNAFCNRFASASTSRSVFHVALSLSMDIITPIPSSSFFSIGP
jgi:hypothetical protein